MAAEPPLEEDSLYSILNVSRDATTQEITGSYRRLAQTFHPDKVVVRHPGDAARREQAQGSFSKVQEAYEVLSSPEKRSVYDVYGRQGLAAGVCVRALLLLMLMNLLLLLRCAWRMCMGGWRGGRTPPSQQPASAAPTRSRLPV